MTTKIKFILIFITVLIYITEPVFCYWIWTPQTKKWVNPKYAPKDTPKEQLLYAIDFFEAKEYKRALTEFNKIISYYKRSESASEAQYYIGRCYENLNNPYHAFEAYQKVIDEYPFTQRTDEIIKRQFDIAESLYKGKKAKFLGVRFKAFPEQIIDIYKKVVSNAPYSRYAPISQFRIGELYKKIEFYEEAREAFQKIVEDYPDSDMAAEAKFQVAYCAAVGSGESSYDQRLATEAMKEFEEFAKENPGSEWAAKANEEKKKLIEKKADSYLKTAQFYERMKKYESAIIYYNMIVKEFPGSSITPSALEKSEVIKKRLEKRK